jgi:hypothetical protein
MSDWDPRDLNEIEILRLAGRIVSDFGADAQAFAELRVNQMLKIKDKRGVVAWMKVLEAIRQLQSAGPKSS